LEVVGPVKHPQPMAQTDQIQCSALLHPPVVVGVAGMVQQLRGKMVAQVVVVLYLLQLVQEGLEIPHPQHRVKATTVGRILMQTNMGQAEVAAQALLVLTEPLMPLETGVMELRLL